jgi:hypothetical protein
MNRILLTSGGRRDYCVAVVRECGGVTRCTVRDIVNSLMQSDQQGKNYCGMANNVAHAMHRLAMPLPKD